MERLNRVYEKDPSRAPTIFFINEGVHTCANEDEENEDNDLYVTFPMQIIGAGRDQTIVKGGGFDIQGTKEEGKNVVLKDMTISETSGNGVFGWDGLSWLCDSLTITQCRWSGVYAENKKGRFINCVITQCGKSGIACYENAFIEVEGNHTKVDGNVTRGGSSQYGLSTSNTLARIHLLFPLTKESVSTNNIGGGNYGGTGTIQTVSSF
jgi:hypothetical protein